MPTSAVAATAAGFADVATARDVVDALGDEVPSNH